MRRGSLPGGGRPVCQRDLSLPDCRKAASAPILPFVVFPADRVTWTKGLATTFHSSPGVTRTFCGRCGSPLTYRQDDHPDRIDIMTCSLDDPEALPPSLHVWVADKLTWDHVVDGLPAFATTRSAG